MLRQEEYHRSKETHNHAVNVYEKEIRKGRKEAFKSGSSLVKLQEELKATRNSLRITQSGLESEKLKSARREQEAFTAQYQLIGVQEELQRAQERIQVVESERDALKTSLQEEEVARIAAEGRIALPAMEEDDEDLLMQSPRKSPRKPRIASEDSADYDKENRPVPKRTLELQGLHEELSMERRMRERAQEQVEFMKMECQFQCCSCRIAEKDGKGYVHDVSFSSEMERIRALVPREHTPPASLDEDVEMTMEHHEPETESEGHEMMEDAVEKSFHTAMDPSQIALPSSTPEKEISEVHITDDFGDETIQNDAVVEDAPIEAMPAPNSSIHDFATETEAEADVEPEAETEEVILEELQEPQTPIREFRTISTTTTIPMLFSPYPASQAPTTPMTLPSSRTAATFATPNASALKADGTIDREAALAQIRERRGRARSVAMGQATPRKGMVEGVQGRRDISAPNRL